jgi:hypothetical protein
VVRVVVGADGVLVGACAQTSKNYKAGVEHRHSRNCGLNPIKHTTELQCSAPPHPHRHRLYLGRGTGAGAAVAVTRWQGHQAQA